MLPSSRANTAGNSDGKGGKGGGKNNNNFKGKGKGKGKGSATTFANLEFAPEWDFFLP